MNAQTKSTLKKRGPKPLGDAAMSPAERQRRRRERLRAEGAKDFLLKLEGLHLEYVERLAQSQGISSAAALRLVLLRALDQYVGVIRRVERMIENGVPDEVRDQFFRDYLFPELPLMPERRPEHGDA